MTWGAVPGKAADTSLLGPVKAWMEPSCLMLGSMSFNSLDSVCRREGEGRRRRREGGGGKGEVCVSSLLYPKTHPQSSIFNEVHKRTSSTLH